MKKARYICFEGTEGVGKTTQVAKLVEYLRSKGYKVLETKEPGTSHAPLTLELRNVMLNAKYDGQLTRPARELVSQAIRSIHLETVIAPALPEYDFIIQDRGTLSGQAYGVACGNEFTWIEDLIYEIIPTEMGNRIYKLYDDVVYLTGDVKSGLNKALNAKQEFEAGDSIEKKGLTFMETVNKNMNEYSRMYNTTKVSVDGKGIEEVHQEIVKALGLEG